jgi:hypothetical protein
MCDVGRYCPGKATSKADMNQLFVCPATLYCPSGTSRIPNTESDGCRVGYYCPEGVAAPMPCPAGTFNPHRGRGEVGECVQCTPGFYCGSSGLSNVTGECDPGHYCPAGSSSATQINCPPRYYRSTPRGENEDFCSVCPRGFYCPSGTSMPIPCPHGYYCVTGAEIPGPCPIGTFANVSGLRSQDECIPCSPGEYCDGLGLPIPTGLCDAGYYCIGRAQTSAPPGLPTGGLCPRGGYCPPGSSFPTSCDQGTFNNFTGGSTQNDCTACLPGYYCSGTNLPSPSGPCAAGYYCQGGAYLPTQFLTPLGHYSLAGSSAPEECPLGTFNPEMGKSACVPCIEGYYCPTRAMTSYYPCPVGGYCPRGSTLPRACPIGTYQPFVRRQNVSDCLQCPEGSYCAKENATSPSGLCVAGYYCKRACVTSTCTQIVNSKREIENWFPVDNTTENQYGGECPLGKYCPDGTANPVRCPKGTIRDGTRGITADDSCTPCPGGFYCPNTGMSTQLQNNQPIPCQEGYFCPGKVPGSVNKGCEDPFCSTFRAQPCDINTIGCDGVVNVDLNLTIPQARVCPTGFFCPTGSILPTKCMPLRDGRSTFAPRRQQKACELCLPGRYCDINRVSTLQVPAICPRGRYCPIGSTPLMPRCPAGSWNPFTGLHNRTQCRLCPAGRYCPYAGTYATTVVQMPFCFGGYYCTKGAAAGDGRVGVLGGVAGVCRRGHYCVNGTMNITQFPCPPGTYKPIFGGSSAVTCLSCTPGKHCKGLGLMAPAGDCAPGYYCPRGCVDAYCSSRTCVSSIVPRLGWTGGACPKGHECVLGSHMPVPCKPGTYQSRTTSFSCTTCPPGYHCGLAAHSPEPCPEGYYCPGGTGTRSIPKCPIGTYNTWIRKTNLTDCLLCPAGQYCDRRAMNKSTGVCLPGFYCTSGAKHPNGTAGARGGIGGRCPQGHYCPAGTKFALQFPCPPGTYNPSVQATNKSSCVRCTPGMYCGTAGLAAPSGPCANGYYCPTSCQDQYCSNAPCKSNCGQPMPYHWSKYAIGGECPPGFYCPQKQIAGVRYGATAPIMCPAGTYAPNGKMSVCLSCPYGRWCSERTTQPQPCPAGYFCPNGTKTARANPCPLGTYSPTSNNTRLSQCLKCSAGRYCGARGLSAPSGLCAAAYFCESGASTATGIVGERGGRGGSCPAGYFCPEGTVTDTFRPCPPGTYQPFLNKPNASACIPCTPGYYCPSSAMSAVGPACALGYYCPRGCSDNKCMNMPCKTNCADKEKSPYVNGGLCPRGHYCPGYGTRGTIQPIGCPAGTYSMDGAQSCTKCPAGFLCPPRTWQPTSCPAGKYCPIGSRFSGNNCPVGSYNPITRGNNLTDCLLCPAGKYCSILGAPAPSGDCFPGHYCRLGAVNGRGQRGALGGSGGACVPGHYCPPGTQTPRQFKCPPGTYQPSSYASRLSDCQRCLPGYYCQGSGNANVTAPCSPGYSCLGGCDNAKCDPCPFGFQCPNVIRWQPVLTKLLGPTRITGQVIPQQCTAGTYTQLTGSGGCATCPAGYYCLPGAISKFPQLCQAGHYCPAGTGLIQPSCPRGSYSIRVGLNASTQCKLCPGGRFCASTALLAPTGLCAAGWYCNGGSVDAYGRIGNLGGFPSPFPRDGSGRQRCPIGHYCPSGSARPTACPIGTYNPQEGLFNSSQCRPCDAGSYCRGTGLTKPTAKCAGGFLCLRGCQDPRCTTTSCLALSQGPCPIGHYCPNGTTAAIPCASGTYSGQTRAWKCTVCPAGYYCPFNAVAPVICPKGRYCPKGTRSESVPQCPIGTYNNRTGLTNVTLCRHCLPSRACTVTGLPVPDMWCTAGYYCMRGAATVRGGLGIRGGSGGICPSGHYCPPATSNPLKCPIKTFNPNRGSTALANCRICTAGSYCPTQAASAPASRCDAGWYCLSGQSTARPGSTHCPVGHYCPRGAVEPWVCPAGTYNPLRNSTNLGACLKCPAGKYCLAGSGVPSGLCSGGYICTGGNKYPTPRETPCLPGYYCPRGSSAMSPCPPAFFCRRARLERPEGQCAPGYYCTLRATSPRPTNTSTGGICPVGHFCPSNSSRPIACPKGTYQPNRFVWSPVNCLPCTAGNYCPRLAQSSVTDKCSAGYYCPPRQTTPTPANYKCPAGHYCPLGSPGPRMCPPGQYQNHPSQSACKLCPAGSYCFATSMCPMANATMTPRPCPRGYYCLAGTGSPNSYPCPAGKYSNRFSLKTAAECTDCDPGRYCPKPGTTSVTDLLCTAGFYCISGAKYPTPSDGTTGDRCPVGNYCPAGTSVPLKCPAGTFSPNRGLRSAGDCSLCPPGKYCATPGLVSATGDCKAGYYCPSGSKIRDAKICAFGQYCPAGSSSPKVCQSGFYAPGFRNAQCIACPAGKYCDETEPCKYCNVTVPARDCFNNFTCPRTCPDGHYCMAGTKLATQSPCPAGYFGPRPGLRKFGDCVACPPGNYCPFAGLSTVRALLCSPGYWCKNGSFTAQPRDRVHGEICPIGHYCPAGTKAPIACPIGTYNPVFGAGNITSCNKCSAGHACPTSALPRPSRNCSAGYYCPGGQVSPRPYAFHCPIGFYCPAGSPGPLRCQAGTYSNRRGLTACIPCPAGKYCVMDDMCQLVNGTVPRDCPMGYYCPSGTQFGDQFPCPLGTFGNRTGLVHADNCTKCASGKSCERPGLIDGSLPQCAASYYCAVSASRPDPTDNVTGNLCPRGHYCPPGTGTPQKCPAGTFNNATGLYNASQCRPCVPGWYCELPGLVQPTGQCFGGYYCPPAQTSPTPPAHRCPVGYRCPFGSAEPLHCDAGTQAMGVGGLDVCGQCTRGYFCNIVEQQHSPYFLHGRFVLEVPCPRGFVCPQGTASQFQTPCLPGTYSNTSRLQHPTECTQCPGGKYCLNPGQIKPTGLCEAGYYCRSGSWTPEPKPAQIAAAKAGPCPSGHWCPAGVAAGIPCPMGTYYSGIGASNRSFCRPCQPSYYCSTTGNFDPTGQGLCSAGFYCPGGNIGPAEIKYTCPKGHFCGVGSEAPSPCPAGTYNQGVGRSTCDQCPALKYCPIGTVNPIDCKIGTVCPAGSAYELTCAKGLYVPPNAGRMADMSECRECDAGKFCLNGTISGDCAAGYICTKGNFRPDPDHASDGLLPSRGGNKLGGICPLGYYCPPGTPKSLPCKNNTVGTRPGLHRDSDCSACPPGYYCIPGSIYPIPCPKGHYCPGFIGKAGGLIPCPAGTFNEKMLAPDPSWCDACREGYYCPISGMPSSFKFPTPPGYYSSFGQVEPFPCPAGTWNGKSNGTARNVSACEACPVGFYCNPQTTSYASTPCPAGAFCPLGTDQPNHCPGGHYCPVNASAPILCPEGYFCDPKLDSTTFLDCWRGTYCPSGTEIPLLCPFGSIGVTADVVRSDPSVSCVYCPPGTYSNDTLFCNPCGAGHVCLGGTPVELPETNSTEHGYICPIGHYCPTGASIETPCPTGTFRNATGGQNVTDCFLCPDNYYNPNEGQAICTRCGPSAAARSGSTSCTCIGANRVYQAEDLSCRCLPGYVFYNANNTDERLSADDSTIDCTPITYAVCRPGYIRATDGECVEETDAGLCAHCAAHGGGKVETTTGMCLCNNPPSVDSVCDATCRNNSAKVHIDMSTNELVHYNPTTNAETRLSLSRSDFVGAGKCAGSSVRCDVKVVALTASGPYGVYNPILESSGSASVSTTRRMLQQSSTAANLGALVFPTTCINLGDAMAWDVSDSSRLHFPVYHKDSLLNTNPTFDYTQFRHLAEIMRDPNYNITLFTFAFSQPGVHVFYDNALPKLFSVIRVANASQRCPDTPFMTTDRDTLIMMGARAKRNISESPNWVLIGVLLAGLLLLFVGLCVALWQVRRAMWGMVGNTLPRYRTLAMYHLAGKAAGVQSRGYVRGKAAAAMTAEEADLVAHKKRSRVVTLRLDTPVHEFLPSWFIATTAELVRCLPQHILIVSVSEGSTIVRFVFHECEDPQHFADELIRLILEPTNDIHVKMPILAFDAGRDDDLSFYKHPAYAMANVRDDYWDYERQVDVKEFNVRTLYDKVEDQTLEIVRELATQSDDVMLLCDKILVESELLKDMFVRVKSQIDSTNRRDVEVLDRRGDKMAGGTVEFELNEDVKFTLQQFLKKYFDDSLEATRKSIDEKRKQEAEAADKDRKDQLAKVEQQIADLDKAAAKEADDIDAASAPARAAANAEAELAMLNAEPADLNDLTSVDDQRRLAMRRVATPSNEYPREIRDDSDVDDDERVVRTKKREAMLARKLRRARRLVDNVTMPLGLDDVPPSTGIRTVEEALRAAKQRNAWKQVRLEERQKFDADVDAFLSGEANQQNGSSAAETVAASKKRCDKVYRRLRLLRDALAAVEVPAALADDDSLPAAERAARAEKRGRFIQQKMHKARVARAEASVSLGLDTDSDDEPRESIRRREAAQDVVRTAMNDQSYENALPSAEVPNLTSDQRNARRAAADKAIAARTGAAQTVLDVLALPENLSDHSDLDEAERANRRNARAAAGLPAGTGTAAAGGVAPAAATTSPGKVVRGAAGKAKSKTAALAERDAGMSGMQRVDFTQLIDERRNGPKEYQDDADLDNDERALRRDLREAFAKGKEAPIDALPPADEKERGLAPAELRRREEINLAFRRGREAAHGADPAALKRAADEVKKQLETATGDAAKYAALGKKQAAAAAMPEEFTGDTAAKRELRAAFENGRRAITVGAPLAPLPEPEERSVFEAAKETAMDVPVASGLSQLEKVAHDLGRAAERARTFEDGIAAEARTGNAKVAGAMNAAFEQGRAAGATLSVPAELKTEDEKRAFWQAVGGSDVAAAAAGTRGPAAELAARKGVEMRQAATELLDNWRDDVPLLSEDEVKERRACRAAFIVGLQGKAAEVVMDGLARDDVIRESDRSAATAAFAAARKAQKAADSAPVEMKDPAMVAAHARGRMAGHLADAVTHVPSNSTNAAALRNAVAKGAKAGLAVSAVPPELEDIPGLPAADAKVRAKGRAALIAGRQAHAASHLVEELEARQHETTAVAQDHAAASALPAAGALTPQASLAAASFRGKVPKANASSSPAPRQGAQGASAAPTEELTSAASAAAFAAGGDAEEALKLVKKEFASQFKAMKQQHAVEQSQAIEELEEELIGEAKRLDSDLDEQFTRERKRLGDKHHLELMNADPSKAEGIKGRHLAQMQHLDRGQEEARKQAHEVIIKRGAERKTRLKAVLEAKALNELRLLKTISNDQEKEIQRLQQQAQEDAQRGDMAREEELAVQKQRLLEKIQARERRLKVKASKEREFLASELREVTALRAEGIETGIRDRETILAGRLADLAQRGLMEGADLAEEQDRLHQEAIAEKERRLTALKSEAETDRLVREKNLSERHAKRAQVLITASQNEVEELLEQQKALEDESKKAVVAPDAEAAAAMIARQEQQRRELAAQLDAARKEDAAKFAVDQSQIQAEADRKIAQKEKERGQRLSDEQKRAIMDECTRDAQRMKSAMSEEEKAQQALARKKLEEKRRKKEQELHKRQLEEQQREMQRQEEAAKQRQAELQAKMKIAPQEMTAAAKAAQAAADEQKAVKLSEIRKAHAEEAAAVQAELDASAGARGGAAKGGAGPQAGGAQGRAGEGGGRGARRRARGAAEAARRGHGQDAGRVGHRGR